MTTLILMILTLVTCTIEVLSIDTQKNVEIILKK